MSILIKERVPATIISDDALNYFKCPIELGVLVYILYLKSLDEIPFLFDKLVDDVFNHFDQKFPKDYFECYLHKVIGYLESSKRNRSTQLDVTNTGDNNEH